MTPWTWCRCLDKTTRSSRILMPGSRNGNQILYSKRSAKSNLSKITVARSPQRTKVKTSRCSRSRWWKELWHRPQLSNKDCNRPCMSTRSVSRWLLKVTSPPAQAASSKAQPILTTYAHSKPIISPTSESCLSERNEKHENTFRQCRIVILILQSRCHQAVQVLPQVQKYIWTTLKTLAEVPKKISWYLQIRIVSLTGIKMTSLMQVGSNRHQNLDNTQSRPWPPINKELQNLSRVRLRLKTYPLSGVVRTNILEIWQRE